jgi:8-oxo-dGTP diphosphatase
MANKGVQVGVGAVVMNAAGAMFMAQRGTLAKNERGYWEFPGGGIEYGEAARAAIEREFLEEYGMVIQAGELLGFYEHVNSAEDQHWVSPTFLAQHISGEPRICEPDKCAAIGWFTLDDLPAPLSKMTRDEIEELRQRQAK